MGQDYYYLEIYGGKGYVYDIKSVKEYLEISSDIEQKIRKNEFTKSRVLNFVHTIVIFDEEPAKSTIDLPAGYLDSQSWSYLSINENDENVVVLTETDRTLLFPFEVKHDEVFSILDETKFTIFEEECDGYYFVIEELLTSYNRLLGKYQDGRDIFYHKLHEIE